MKIRTVISHEYLDGIDLHEKTIVVIDTLRATSVMTTAYNNKIRSLNVAGEPEDAIKLRYDLIKNGVAKEEILLGGERGGQKIEGFDLSNSPLEYAYEKVGNKDIILTTSNGTKTMMKIGNEHDILIASLLNVGAVVNEIKKLNKDLLIVNAGTDGALSLEDFITGGAIASHFLDEDLCDTTLASVVSYKSKDIMDYIKKSLHYNRLKKLGYDKDLEYCFRENIIGEVPIVRNFKIIR